MSLAVVLGVIMFLGLVVEWRKRKVARVMKHLAYAAGGAMLSLCAILIVAAFVVIALI
jgi:hypothetical protein